jgi:hypothetical protein
LKTRKKKLKLLPGRITLIFLISVYLLFSIGIIKATHFCMGRVASVALFSAEARKCPCSLFAGEKNSCCDDEHELIRIENEQKTISSFTLAVPQWFVLENLYCEQFITSGDTKPSERFYPPGSSLPPKIPRWKFHCSLVLYGDPLIG